MERVAQLGNPFRQNQSIGQADRRTKSGRPTGSVPHGPGRRCLANLANTMSPVPPEQDRKSELGRESRATLGSFRLASDTNSAQKSLKHSQAPVTRMGKWNGPPQFRITLNPN